MTPNLIILCARACISVPSFAAWAVIHLSSNFSSSYRIHAGEDGDKPMSKPHKAHASACAVAGIEELTLHGLRRSFGTLSEWLELPAGVVAQIQGHKPSATAEKHYRVRPLDLLRLHHERLEAWILEQAGVEFDPQAQPGKLHVVLPLVRSA